MGDLNQPIQGDRRRQGTNLLLDWVNKDKMTLLNEPGIHTRIDPSTGKGSTPDLCLVSKIIERWVQSFEVDTCRKWSPFKVKKKHDSSLEKKFSDHLAIQVKLLLPMATAQKGGGAGFL